MSLEADHSIIHAAFGLRYRSRLPWLPAPRVGKGETGYDVDVAVGHEAPVVPMEAFTQPRFEGSPGSFLFRTRTIADFRVEMGERVLILPKTGVEALKIWNLLFGAVTGALMIQRCVLALHGCALETPAGAVVFCGDSGAGKSTLAGLLLGQGFRILDDNIVALHPYNDGYQVQPGLGHLRLTGATLQVLGQSPRGPAFPAPYQPKYLHGLQPGEYCDQPRILRHVYLLDRSRDMLWEDWRGAEKLKALQRHIFLRHMVESLGQQAGHFMACLNLANSVPVSRLGCPPDLAPNAWAEKVAARIRCA